MEKIYRMFGRLLSSEKNVLLLITTRAEGIENWLGLLAYRIIINYTAAKSVLNLVSTFRLACSDSHRQETKEKDCACIPQE